MHVSLECHACSLSIANDINWQIIRDISLINNSFGGIKKIIGLEIARLNSEIDNIAITLPAS